MLLSSTPTQKEIIRVQNNLHVALPYPEESVPKKVNGSSPVLRTFLAVRRKSSRRVTSAADPESDAVRSDRMANRNSKAIIPVGVNFESRKREKRKPRPATDRPENTARAVESWLMVCVCHLMKRSLVTCISFFWLHVKVARQEVFFIPNN